ncbi:MAG TPA: hypothetical protein VF001_05350, partial [Candidatus Limnocylindria bacterium]
ASERAAVDGRSGSRRDVPMTYRALGTANAIASGVFGLAALLVPTALASLYAITFDGAAVYVARLLGGSYVGYAIASFLTRDTSDRATRRAIAAANGFAWAAGCVVSTFVQLQGLANGFGWATAALELGFAVGWIWTYLAERPSRPEPQGAAAR